MNGLIDFHDFWWSGAGLGAGMLRDRGLSLPEKASWFLGFQIRIKGFGLGDASKSPEIMNMRASGFSHRQIEKF